MFNKIVEVLKEFIGMNSNKKYRTNLDAYIAERNPQNNCDVDYLEREYFSKQGQTLHLGNY
jgi:hypothetical protein